MTIEKIPGLPAGTLGYRGLGVVTADDYRTVLIPAENEKDLAEIPASVKDNLEIIPVEHIDEVLGRALAEPLSAIEWTDDDEHAAEPPVHGQSPESGVAVRH